MKAFRSEGGAWSLKSLPHLSWFVAVIVQLAWGALATQPNLAGDWPTYGNGPTHTGYFPGTLNGLPFAKKWAAPMPHYSISQAAIGGGRVYVSVGYYYSAMSLRALDAATGVGVWTNNLPGKLSLNPPTYDSGSLFVQQTDGGSSASWTGSFDAATGHTNWVTPFTSQGNLYMAPIVADGAVFTDSGYYGGLTRYNRTSGAQNFFVALNGGLGCDQWTPAYYNGKLYMWVNGYLSEHNPQTGAVNWTLTNATPSEFLYSMKRTVAIADGRAYCTSTSKLFCADLAQHQNVWTNTGAWSGTPAVANGIVYAISNQLVAAFTTNGVFVRTYDTTNSVEKLSGELIVTDDVLLVAGSYGVYVFNLSDGRLQQLISSFRTPCYCYYSSTISLANNTLYVASGDQNVYAYAALPTTAITLTNIAKLPSGAFQFGFTNIAGASFTARTTTDPSLPLANWTALGTVPEISPGRYQMTDLQATQYSRRYYCVSSP